MRRISLPVRLTLPFRILEEALDLLFPPRCAGCGRPGALWCAACAAAVIPIMPPVCPGCGIPWPEGDRCPACRTDPLRLAGIRSACLYQGPLRRAVHRLKFHGRYAVAQALAPLMADGWARFALEADLLIPVPAHRGRERQRGYNQAALLAEALAEHLSLPVRPEALRRVRATPSQVGMDHLARRANVQGAFQADPRWIAGRRVAVIDDVCTSGATLEACAAALHQAGAVAVWGFTLARVIRQRSLSIPLGGAYGADRAGTEH